ncbi:MAG TPA: hypothetical protein VNT55_17740, partial [Baekduia sp.]|nr:hypothetical protein [Baekduia sp.]
TLQLAFDRRVSGRRSGGRCVAGRRKGARCLTYKSVGSLSRTAPAGAVRIAITGRLSSGALRAGTYRLRVSARAADGRRASTTTLTFTVVSARRAA